MHLDFLLLIKDGLLLNLIEIFFKKYTSHHQMLTTNNLFYYKHIPHYIQHVHYYWTRLLFVDNRIQYQMSKLSNN